MKRLVLAFTAALSWPSRGLAEPPPAAPSAVTLATARCDRSELDFPAFSRLARRGDAYSLYPEAWIHDLDAVPPVQ